MKLKHYRILKTCTAVLLALVTALVPALTASASSAGGKYVSEVYIAYGSSASDARKTLQEKGFTPVEGNVNEGGSTYAMLGYKTTNDIRESVTDLAVMNMRGGFNVEDYKTLLRSQKTQIADFLTEFMAVIKEYRLNYENGKSKAIVVHDILNNYYEDDTGMPMGDLLLADTLQDRLGISGSIGKANPDNLPDLITILLQGNAQVIKSIEVLLSMAADTEENSWVDRFAELDYDMLLEQIEESRPDLNTAAKQQQYLDNLYGETAESLGLALNEFRDRLTDYENMPIHLDTATEAEIKEAFGSGKDIASDNGFKSRMDLEQWLTIGLIYEGLKAYEGGRFGQGELLEFFMEDQDTEDYEIFYPMAAALSEGQRAGLSFVSLEKLLEYAFSDDDAWKAQAKKNSANFGKPADISVYVNMDRDLYKEDGSVAMTDAAQRAKAVDAGIGTTGTEDDWKDTLSRITQISWAVTGVSLAVAGTSTLVSYLFMRNAAYDSFWADLDVGFSGWNDEYLEAIYRQNRFESFVKYNKGTELCGAIQKARFAYILSKALVITCLAISVITAVLTVIDLLTDPEFEQLPIPKYMVDSRTDPEGQSYQVYYKAVECNRTAYFGSSYTKQQGDAADLNADEGKQWLALYVSKNSSAGNPLTPDFLVQKSDAAPSGYEGTIHIIGEKGAVNTASDAYRNYSTLSRTWQNLTGSYSQYVFYKISSEAKTYDPASGNMTASIFNPGMAALIGACGLAIGAAGGIIVYSFVKRKKAAAKA